MVNKAVADEESDEEPLVPTLHEGLKVLKFSRDTCAPIKLMVSAGVDLNLWTVNCSSFIIQDQ